MRYLSVCSGIEAATVATKACSKCGDTLALKLFHKHPSGPMGRHSWCKACANAAQRGVRKRKDTTENRRERLLKQRYGMTSADKANLLASQGGECAICGYAPTRAVIDHCHTSGKVRGVLCHRCNIRLPAIEDRDFLAGALRYLGRAA